jgi:protein involved in polysaccharide export with SLBB domain
MKTLLYFFRRTILALACLLVAPVASAQSEASGGAGEHQLAPGDSIDIRVFQEPLLDSAKVPVSKEGRVSIQLAGEVDVMGMTPTQAARAIETKLKQGYLVHPKVTVIISGYAQRRFTVLGAVNKPGAFNFPGGQNITVLEAIGMAGGYNKQANPSKIILKRAGGGEPIKLDGKKLGEGAPLHLKAGDVITVEESRF